MTDEPLSKQAMAAIGMLEHTGIRTFQIRYSDDEEPVVWMAIAGYQVDKQGRPVAKSKQRRYEVAAAIDPEEAIYRLCDQIVDGGFCLHCKRPTGFERSALHVMPLDEAICWYQYDPELQVYRRGCEGDDK